MNYDTVHLVLRTKKRQEDALLSPTSDRKPATASPGLPVALNHLTQPARPNLLPAFAPS